MLSNPQTTPQPPARSEQPSRLPTAERSFPTLPSSGVSASRRFYPSPRAGFHTPRTPSTREAGNPRVHRVGARYAPSPSASVSSPIRMYQSGRTVHYGMDQHRDDSEGPVLVRQLFTEEIERDEVDDSEYWDSDGAITESDDENNGGRVPGADVSNLQGTENSIHLIHLQVANIVPSKRYAPARARDGRRVVSQRPSTVEDTDRHRRKRRRTNKAVPTSPIAPSSEPASSGYSQRLSPKKSSVCHFGSSSCIVYLFCPSLAANGLSSSSSTPNTRLRQQSGRSSTRTFHMFKAHDITCRDMSARTDIVLRFTLQEEQKRTTTVSPTDVQLVHSADSP
jgi:hypothetical protein